VEMQFVKYGNSLVPGQAAEVPKDFVEKKHPTVLSVD